MQRLSGQVNRIIAWADRLQRRHRVLGFPYAVVKKYGDDEGGREAALITYYGFLSIFPLLLLGVATASTATAVEMRISRSIALAMATSQPSVSCEEAVSVVIAPPPLRAWWNGGSGTSCSSMINWEEFGRSQLARTPPELLPTGLKRSL